MDGGSLGGSALAARATGDLAPAFGHLREVVAAGPDPPVCQLLGGLLFFDDDLAGARREWELAFRFSYMDPGGGGLLTQAVVVGLAGAAVVVKLGWRKMAGLVDGKAAPSRFGERRDGRQPLNGARHRSSGRRL